MSTRSNESSTDDGLQWLRDVRRKLFVDADCDLKKLGDRYRQVQASEPEKVLDLRVLVAEAVRKAAK